MSSKLSITFHNVPPNQPLPLPPGVTLRGMRKPKFHAGGFATITIDVPEQKRHWKHEPGNCTLHFSWPFIRLPRIDVLELRNPSKLMLLYAFLQGAAASAIVSAIFGRINWGMYLFVLLGLVYTMCYRRALRRGLIEQFRKRITE